MATTRHSLAQRMVGAARVNVHIYEEVEADTSATPQAMAVVALVAVATGIGSLGVAGVGGLIAGVVVGVVGWALWAWLTFFIGTKLLGTAATQTNWGQLARTLGFAQSPGILKVLAFLPVVGGLIFIAVSFWQLATMVVAVRQALDYNSTWRAVGVVVIGFIPYAVLMSLVLALVG